MMFKWKWWKGHCWVWTTNELSQQVKTWPSGPFIFLCFVSWKACSLEIHPNSHRRAEAPPFVQHTELCYATWKLFPFPFLTAKLLEAKQRSRMLLWSTHTLHWWLGYVNETVFLLGEQISFLKHFIKHKPPTNSNS